MQPHHRLYPDQPAVYCLASRDIDPSSVRTGSVGPPPRDRHAKSAFRRVDPLPTRAIVQYTTRLSNPPTPTLSPPPYRYSRCVFPGTILLTNSNTYARTCSDPRLLPDASSPDELLPNHWFLTAFTWLFRHFTFPNPNVHDSFGSLLTALDSYERRIEESQHFEHFRCKSYLKPRKLCAEITKRRHRPENESPASKSVVPVLNWRYC